MNVRPCVGVVTGLLVLMLAGACSARFVQSPTALSGVPTLGGGQTEVELGTKQPQAPAATGQNVSSQAPICQATSSCAALNAEQIPLDCVKKIPYTNVLVPKGTIFQVLDDSGEFTCIDSGVVFNEKQVLTCHGKELYAFQLKLTNASCGGKLESGAGRCQAGYGYDAANQCCAQASADAEGSATVTINLGACPVP